MKAFFTGFRYICGVKQNYSDMNNVNSQKIEEYLSSLECPVCRKKTSFRIVRLSSLDYRLVASPSCCCEYWRNRVYDIFRIESTRAESCEMTGTAYRVPS